jgi:hypothetical protein
MLTYILIVVLLYVLLFILNMSHFERTILYKFFTHGGLKNILSVPEYKKDNVAAGEGLKEFFLSPFYFHRHKITKISDGTLLNFYCYHDKYFEKCREMSSKMFWNDYFVENGVKTPKLYATTQPYRVYKPILPGAEYISKPEHGLQGIGIHVIKGDEITPTENNHLIQEKIDACGYKGGRSFRVVTTYDGELVSVEELRNDNKVTSNGLSGGNVKMCDKDMCGEYQKLHKPIKKLCELHKRDFADCFCIGWDVLVDCKDAYVIEGNWPNALFGNKDDIADEFYDMFKPKVEKFYTLNNI